MKFGLLVITICINVLSISQFREPTQPDKISLQNTEWTSPIAVFEHIETESFSLTRKEIDQEGFDWGHFISFSEENFNTYYRAPCGNDCFISINGSYKTVGFNRIEIFVETINRRGFCASESQSPNKSYGVYILSQSKAGVLITKEH